MLAVELRTSLNGVEGVNNVCSSIGANAAPLTNVLAQKPGQTKVVKKRQTTVAENKTNKKDMNNNKLESVSNQRNDRNDNVVNGPKMPDAKHNTHPVQKDEPRGRLGVSTPVKAVLPSRDQGLARAVPPLSPPLGGARGPPSPPLGGAGDETQLLANEKTHMNSKSPEP